MNGMVEKGRTFSSLMLIVIGLGVLPLISQAQDGEIVIIRDVPAHVPYRAIPPGQIENRVNTSPAQQVNQALGNGADHQNHLITSELVDAEVATLGSVSVPGSGAGPYRSGVVQSNIDSLLGSTASGPLGGLTSTFGGAGSALSNNVNSVTGTISHSVTGSLSGLEGR